MDTCKDCRFRRPGISMDVDTGKSIEFDQFSRCHRREPNGIFAAWPRVELTDWCGEFQPKQQEGGE